MLTTIYPSSMTNRQKCLTILAQLHSTDTTQNTTELVTELLTLLPSELSIQLASTSDIPAALVELESILNAQSDKQYEMAAVRPRTSPLNSKKMVKSTPPPPSMRTSTHYSSPWAESPMVSKLEPEWLSVDQPNVFENSFQQSEDPFLEDPLNQSYSFAQDHSKLNKKLRDYEKSMDISEQRIQELELELQASLQEIKSLSTTIVEYKGREKNLKSHSDMLEESCQTLSQQLSDSKADIHDYKLKYEGLNSGFEKLKRELLWKEEEIQGLKVILEETRNENMDFKTQIQVFKEIQQQKQQKVNLLTNTSSQTWILHQEHKDTCTNSIGLAHVDSQTCPIQVESLATQTLVEYKHVYTETEGYSEVFEYQNQSSGVIVDVMEMNQTTNLFSIQENEWKEKCGQLETELAFMSLLESQVDKLMDSCRQFEQENNFLKNELQEIQTQVLDTRKDLDIRKHFDTEVHRWLNSIKTDLSQIELIAAIKNKDMEDHIDAQEVFKDRIRFLEKELQELQSMSFRREITTVSTQVEWETSHKATLVNLNEPLSIHVNKKQEQEPWTFNYTWLACLTVAPIVFIYTWLRLDSNLLNRNTLAVFMTWLDEVLLGNDLSPM